MLLCVFDVIVEWYECVCIGIEYFVYGEFVIVFVD